MTGFVHSSNLSDQVLVRKVEQRFGLVGYARLCKVFELVALGNGVASLSRSDWVDALQCDGVALDGFLAYCVQAGGLSTSQADGANGLLAIRVIERDTLCPSAVPGIASSVLPRVADEWVAWCRTELNLPGWQLNEATTRRMFARWCAVNVTTEEATRAIESAGRAGEVSAAAIHDHLNLLRRQRIEQARA